MMHTHGEKFVCFVWSIFEFTIMKQSTKQKLLLKGLILMNVFDLYNKNYSYLTMVASSKFT